jgi:hypothetical protein
MQPTLTTKPPRRWRRFFIVLMLLVLAGFASLWLLPWLLMPEDLRRIQGEWTAYHIESGLLGDIELNEVNAPTGVAVRITGNRLDFSTDAGGHSVIDLEPDGRKLRIAIFLDQRVSFLGFKSTLPAWLSSPVKEYVGDYTLTRSELVYVLRGKLKDGKQIPLEGEWRKVYLKRK